MYYHNLGYQIGNLDVKNQGVIINAQGFDARSIFTKDRLDKLPVANQRLFDPQMYLKSLDYTDCDRIVNRLGTYPWLNPNTNKYQHFENNSIWRTELAKSLKEEWPYDFPFSQNDKQKLAQSCINFQLNLGVGGIILPSILTEDPETDFSEEINWLIAGVNALPDNLDIPVYATVGISDQCLIHQDPNDSELLKLITDQITSTSGIDGVYLFLCQTIPENTHYISKSRLAWSLLSLCYDLGVRASLKVIVNYCDVFGLACLAAGASSFGGGVSNKSRRMCFSDYENRGGGIRFPKFYSHSLILDLYPQRDIEEKLAANRLLRFISNDMTSASDSLFNALNKGDKIENVAQWAENRNNISTSTNHYIERIIKATEELENSDDKLKLVLYWLQNAERDTTYLAERFKNSPLNCENRHISIWREAFESFLTQYNL